MSNKGHPSSLIQPGVYAARLVGPSGATLSHDLSQVGYGAQFKSASKLLPNGDGDAEVLATVKRTKEDGSSEYVVQIRSVRIDGHVVSVAVDPGHKVIKSLPRSIRRLVRNAKA